LAKVPVDLCGSDGHRLLLAAICGRNVAKSDEPFPQQPADHLDDAETHVGRDTAKEASEYWPFSILGARLKITDSLLALFTFFLIIVGVGQGIFLGRTDNATHKAADAAKPAADVAKEHSSLQIAHLSSSRSSTCAWRAIR
jgi:hypothetical protein